MNPMKMTLSVMKRISVITRYAKTKIGNNTPCRNLQIKRQKNPVDYANKIFDDIRLVNVDPPPKLAYDESIF